MLKLKIFLIIKELFSHGVSSYSLLSWWIRYRVSIDFADKGWCCCYRDVLLNVLWLFIDLLVFFWNVVLRFFTYFLMCVYVYSIQYCIYCTVQQYSTVYVSPPFHPFSAIFMCTVLWQSTTLTLTEQCSFSLTHTYSRVCLCGKTVGSVLIAKQGGNRSTHEQEGYSIRCVKFLVYCCTYS